MPLMESSKYPSSLAAAQQMRECCLDTACCCDRAAPQRINDIIYNKQQYNLKILASSMYCKYNFDVCIFFLFFFFFLSQRYRR